MGKKHTQPNCTACITGSHVIFQYVEGAQLDFLNQHKHCEFYKKGQSVFQAGGKPPGLYCVNEGKIKLTSLSNEGRDQIIHLAKSGDILGYRALLGDDTYSLSAVAMDDCSICFIPKDAFLTLVHQSPRLSAELIKLLTAELRMTEQHLAGMAQKTVRERLAESLLLLKETYGFEPDSQTLNVQLTREEIANLVGTATETTIRLLTEMKQDKWIEMQGKKIILVNLAALEKMAGRDKT